MGLFKDIVNEAVNEMEFIQGRGAPPEAQVRFDVPSAERGSAPEDITDTHYGKFYGIDGVPLPKIEKARKGKKVGDYDTSKMGMLKGVTQPITHNEVPVGFVQTGGVKYLDVDPSYFDDGGGMRPFARIDDVREKFLEFAANYAPAPYVPGKDGGKNGHMRKPSADLIEAAYKNNCFRYWIPLADLQIVRGRGGDDSEMSTPTIGNGLEYILGLKQNSVNDPDLAGTELKSYQINEGNFMTLFNLNPYNFKVYFDKRDPETGKLIARDVTGKVLAGDSVDGFLSDLLKNRKIDTDKHSRELASNGYRYYEGGKFASKSYARAIIQKGYDMPGKEEADRFEIMVQFFMLPNPEDRPDNSKIKISSVDGYNKSDKGKKLKEGRKTGESQYRDGEAVSRQEEITTMESELIPIERLAMRYEINANEYVGLFGRRREGGDTITKETLAQVLQKKIQSLLWVPSIKVDLEKQFKSRPWLWQYNSYTKWRPFDDDNSAYRKFFTFLEPRKYVAQETRHILFNFIECINKGYVIINFTINKNLTMSASFQINKVDPDAMETLWRVRAENEANIQPAPEKYVWAEYDGEKEARIMSDKESAENSAGITSQLYPSLSGPGYENELAKTRRDNQVRTMALAPKKTKNPKMYTNTFNQ